VAKELGARTKAAFEQLKALSDPDIAPLIEQTKTRSCLGAFDRQVPQPINDTTARASRFYARRLYRKTVQILLIRTEQNQSVTRLQDCEV